METKMKKVKITTIILAIILVTMIAFAGVYVKTQNRMENKVKDYTLGRELKGGRVIELKVKNDEEEAQDANKLTAENYETVKNTIEKRLNNLGVEDYTISLNKDDGTIVVELEENDNTDTYAYFLTATGEVQIKEKDEGTVLLSDEMVKKAVYTYTADAESSYQVFIDISLTDEGQAKIQEIQNNYAVFEDEITEIENAQEDSETETEDVETENEPEVENNTETEGETVEEENTEETKKIAILTIAGTEYDIEKIEKNKIRVAIGGKTTNTKSINNNVAVAAELAMLIDSGKYPVEYEIEENRFIETDITETQLTYFAVFIAIIIAIIFVIFTIKYKTKGLLVSISFIGFISLLLLTLRYTNVSISIEGIGALILTIIINLKINGMILEKTKTMNMVNEAIVNTYKEEYSRLIPIIIITLVFCFAGIANLSSFGMIMFWGLSLIAIYNATITKALLKLKESK